MIVSDIYADVYEVTSYPDEARNFSRLSDAVEVLNNKGNFDALLGYVTIQATSELITLPADVQVPLRVNIDDNPAFPRDKLYEYTMNGPGSNSELVDWSWVDKGLTPVFKQPPTQTSLQVIGNVADNTKEVTVYGRNSSGNPVVATYVIGAAAPPAAFLTIERVSKELTSFGVTLQTSGAVVLGTYFSDETEPMYRQIRLSKSGGVAYILFRKKTFRVIAQADYIPIRSKMGVIYMVKALEAYRNDNPGLGDSLEKLAIKLATEEQSANNPFIEISKAIDTPSCRGNVYGRRDILAVRDIWDDACEVFGPIGYSKILDRITDSAQVLANKGNWDVMMGYLRISTDEEIVTLPPSIEVPIKVTIDGNPAFSRNRFYEFSMNSPGTGNDANGAELVGWSWVDRGAVPVAFQPAAETKVQASGIAADNGVQITVIGENEAEGIVDDILTLGDPLTSFSTHAYRRIISVRKPETAGRVTLQTEDNTQILSIYGPKETLPQYRQIRLSKVSNNVYIQYREKSPVFVDIDDIISVRSRMAIIMMMRSVKAFRDGNTAAGMELEAQAIKMANEEQASFNAFAEAAAGSENPTIRNLNYNSRDSIIFADVVDEMSVICGPIGTPKLMDKATEAIEALANKGQWDPLVGYVDINTDQYHYVTLPRYVETILALKNRCWTGEFRNKWHEFNLDRSWGGCSPCSGWADAGEVCATRDVPYAVKLYAIPDSPTDNGKAIRVYGFYRGKRLATQLGDNTSADGVDIVMDASNLAPSDVLFDRIERIAKPPTDGFVNLHATDSTGAEDISIGFYYPDETEPRYRRIKLRKGCTRIRIMYRKRSIKIQSLTDPIHLGSKLALLSMVRSIELMKTDLAQANALENKAEQFLREEQASNNPLDFPDLEWDGSLQSQMI